MSTPPLVGQPTRPPVYGQPYSPAPRRPRRELPRYLRWLLDGLLLLVCLFFSLGTAAIQTTGMADGPVTLAMFGAFGVGIIVLFRRSHPVASTLIAACATLLLPVDNLVVLICLPWVIARRPVRTAWRVGAVACVAAIVALVRDALQIPDRAFLTAVDQTSGKTVQLHWSGYVLVGVLALTVSIGVGLLRRGRGSIEQAQFEQRQLQAELTTELSRQDERDLIARELHDTVAHHLSVVSLRASALEVSGDDTVQEAAQSVRISTHQALEEMRDLIGVLRSGQTTLTAGPGPGRTLTDLAELIATTRESGADVAANVFISGADSAPTALTRAVYRIVQEALTNAIKHAPNARIDLDVRAEPGVGVHVRVSNPLPGAGVPAGGSGSGLLGIRERVASVGGTVDVGPQGKNWVLTSHLPWPTGQ